MRRINKGVEPPEWKAHRNTEGAVYEARPELRESLIREQGYLCAYCMRRITISDGTNIEKTRIEHILSRENHPEQQLSYLNMVLCCDGKINSSEHCDVLKKSHDLSFDLFSEPFFNTLSYQSKDGLIRSSNQTYNNELNRILNLNHSLLKANRHSALNGVILSLNKKGWTRANITKQLENWDLKDSDGKYKAYSGIVTWYLRKKLRQFP